MPTKKIADLPFIRYCNSTEHRAPSMMLYPPGVYRHTCPLCGESYEFTVLGSPTY